MQEAGNMRVEPGISAWRLAHCWVQHPWGEQNALPGALQHHRSGITPRSEAGGQCQRPTMRVSPRPRRPFTGRISACLTS